jgi:hypothetical protein
MHIGAELQQCRNALVVFENKISKKVEYVLFVISLAHALKTLHTQKKPTTSIVDCTASLSPLFLS